MKKAIITILLAAIAYTAISRAEIHKGLCLNDRGDGLIYNGDPVYNYISYASTDAKKGDKVVTVLIKNPTNLAPDDYIYRNDWIIRR